MFRRTRAADTPVERDAPEVGTYREPRRRFGLGFVGLCILALGVWGGIVPYVGPAFGFRKDTGASWQWTTSHALLWLAPGAAAVFAGLLLLVFGPRAFRLGAKGVSGFAALLALTAGLWFVLGPEAYATFHQPVAAAHGSALARFATDVGYNLGVGLCLTAFGALTLGLLRERRGEAVVSRERRPFVRAA